MQCTYIHTVRIRTLMEFHGVLTNQTLDSGSFLLVCCHVAELKHRNKRTKSNKYFITHLINWFLSYLMMLFQLQAAILAFTWRDYEKL